MDNAAAMNSNNGSLAISELFGAAAFIITVVLGLISLIKPFRVNPREFVGDIIWFIAAASMLAAFLADGKLTIPECVAIIGLYVCFIFFAMFRSRTETRPMAPATADRPSVEDPGDLFLEPNTGEDAATTHCPQTNRTSEGAIANDSLLAWSDDASARKSTTRAELLPGLEETPTDRLLVPSEEPSTSQNPTKSSFLSNFPTLYSWSEQSWGERALTIMGLPLLFPIGFTTPACVSEGLEVDATDSRVPDISASNAAGISPDDVRASSIWDLPPTLRTWDHLTLETVRQHWLLCVQLILGPQLVTLVLISPNLGPSNWKAPVIGSAAALLASALLINNTLASGSHRGNSLQISFLAFTTSLTWIYLTATSAVTLLVSLAWILDIPTSLLGATVFAVGQSSNDLFANTAIARRGMPVLAASASFGGPMLNLLLGIGGGGLTQILKPGSGGIYTFHAEAGLFVSASFLLLGLLVTLVWALVKNWRLERGLGISLITIWLCSTIVNVALSV